MQELSPQWQEIFFVHEYFYNCKFTYSFLENYYRDLRDRYSNLPFTATLPDIYYSITGTHVPKPSSLNSVAYRAIDFVIVDELDLDSLYPLEAFADIRYLTARKNSIDSVVPLKRFINMVYLDLAQNVVSNLEPLTHFKSLQILDLCGNSIYDAGPLNSLTSLQKLYLAGNKVEQLNLSNLKSLQELYIGNNQIRSLQGLYQLKQLKELSLGYNPLSSEELAGIKQALPNCNITYEYHPPDGEGYSSIETL